MIPKPLFNVGFGNRKHTNPHRDCVLNLPCNFQLISSRLTLLTMQTVFLRKLIKVSVVFKNRCSELKKPFGGEVRRCRGAGEELFSFLECVDGRVDLVTLTNNS